MCVAALRLEVKRSQVTITSGASDLWNWSRVCSLGKHILHHGKGQGGSLVQLIPYAEISLLGVLK